MNLKLLFFSATLFTFCAAFAQEAEQPINGALLIAPDRNVQRQITQLETLAERGRFAEAAMLLGSILESPNDSFLADTSDAKKRTTQLTLKRKAESILLSLPENGQELYRLQYAAKAQRLLNIAVQNGSAAELQQIVSLYFNTEAGKQAAFLLGVHYYDQGMPALSQLLFNRLTETDGFEPLYSQIKNAAKKHTEPNVSKWLQKTGWLLPNGTAWQNATISASLPILDLVWRSATIVDAKHETAALNVERQLIAGKNVFLPASVPLVVGELIIFKTQEGLTAVNYVSGKRLWVRKELEMDVPERASKILHFNNNGDWAQAFRGNVPILSAFTRIQHWHNRLSGLFCSDGESVYSIEGNSPARVLGQRNIIFVPQAKGQGIQIDDPRNAVSNTIVARCANTGETLWAIGKQPLVQKEMEKIAEQYIDRSETTKTEISEEERFLGGTFFLGGPLPLNENLYALGENSGAIYLFVFDAKTGKQICRQGLMEPMQRIDADGFRRFCSQIPSYKDGILVCPTGAGVLAAFDPTTGSPIWSTTYQVSNTEQPQQQIARNVKTARQINLFELGNNSSTDEMATLLLKYGWQHPSATIVNGRVVFAPSDSPYLFCVDLLSGEILWQQPKGNGLYVACVEGDVIYSVTSESITAVSLNDGEQIASYELPKGMRPSGIGVHSEGAYYLPLTNGQIAFVDLANAKITVKQTFHAESIGNLVAAKGRFFSQKPNAVDAFHQLESLQNWAENELKTNPSNANALFELARIQRASGQFETAIEYLKKSHSIAPSPKSRNSLREMLLERMHSDYQKWSGESNTLLSLCETPEQEATCLVCIADGEKKAYKAGASPAANRIYAETMEKLIRISKEHKMLLPEPNSGSSISLERWLELELPGSAGILPALQAGSLRSQEKWPEGQIVFSKTEEEQAKIQVSHQIGSLYNRVLIPSIGAENPFFAGYSFYLDLNQGRSLLCCDEYGNEMWRLPLSEALFTMSPNPYSGYAYAGYGNDEISTYIKSVNHIIYFVSGNTITAIDTPKSKILWEKTTTAPLLATAPQQNAVEIHHIFRTKCRDPLFTSQNLLCYQDVGRLIGLDPFSGEIIWVRDTNVLGDTLLGDEKHLFLLSLSDNSAIVINPQNGKILTEGKIPKGIVCSYGPYIVCVAPKENVRVSNSFVAEIYDLRDLQQNKPIYATAPLSGDTLIRFAHSNRLFGILKATQTLYVYDMEKQKMILDSVAVPEELEKKSILPASQFRDFHIFSDGKEIVALFVKENALRPSTENGVQRQFNPLQLGGGIQRPSVADGFLMRYDQNGKAAWNAATPIRNCCWIADAPQGIPLLLFGISVYESGGRKTSQFPVLLGVDKKSGVLRFSKKFDDNDASQNIHGFLISADVQNKKIILRSPLAVFHGQFTDELVTLASGLVPDVDSSETPREQQEIDEIPPP